MTDAKNTKRRVKYVPIFNCNNTYNRTNRKSHENRQQDHFLAEKYCVRSSNKWVTIISVEKHTLIYTDFSNRLSSIRQSSHFQDIPSKHFSSETMVKIWHQFERVKRTDLTWDKIPLACLLEIFRILPRRKSLQFLRLGEIGSNSS